MSRSRMAWAGGWSTPASSIRPAKGRFDLSGDSSRVNLCCAMADATRWLGGALSSRASRMAAALAGADG